MQFLDKIGLKTFLTQFKIKDIFGKKSTLENAMKVRQQYLLEIDYDKELAFNTDFLVGDNSPYVGSATVGATYVA